MALLGGNNQSLSIIIRAQDRASKVIDDVQGRAKKFQDRLESMRPTFNKMAVGGAAAFGTLSFGIGKAVQEASRIQEIDRMFDATFDETEDRMARWASEISDKFGRAEQDMRMLAATSSSVLATAFDIPEKKISELTRGMGEAALAISAFDPRIDTAQQAMEGFTQALTGNRQRVIDWGFQVRDGQLKVAALEKGVKQVDGMTRVAGEGMRTSSGEMISFAEAADRATVKLTEQEKAMLTAKLITEQVSVSAQVLKDSQEDWSQISERLSGKMKELAGTLGEQFLPMIEDIAPKIVEVISSISEWIEQNPKLTRNIILVTGAVAGTVAVLGTLGIVILTVAPAISALGTTFMFLGTKVIPILARSLMFLATNPIGLLITAIAIAAILIIKHWDKVKAVWNAVVDFLSDKMIEFADMWQNAWNAVTDALSTAWEGIKSAVKAAIAFVVGTILIALDTFFPGWQERLNKILEFWKTVWNGIKEAVMIAWENIKTFVSTVMDGLRVVIETGVNTVKEVWSRIWNGIKSFTETVLDQIKEVVRPVVDWIKDRIQDVLDAWERMKSLVSAPVKFAGNVASSVGSGISSFASSALSRGAAALNFQHGGRVPGPMGTPQPIIAHGQEQIIPAGRSAGGGTTLSVNIGRIEVGDRSDIPFIRQQIEEAFDSILQNHKIGS